jgi:hypothetical protein
MQDVGPPARRVPQFSTAMRWPEIESNATGCSVRWRSMATLRFREKGILEEFLDMRSGYVLNFSDRTFAEFFRDFGIDIDDAQFLEGHSGSKANRLRSFWERAPDQLVGEILTELIEYAQSYRADHPATDGSRAIAARLMAGRSTPMRTQSDLDRGETGGPAGAISTRPLEIFFSYAHEDEELMDVVRRQLVVHERTGRIVKWHDRKIPAGEEWRRQIDQRIEQAHVILLFMSPHFIESHYCYEIEGEIALRRHQDGSARVIPVVLRPCEWTITPFGDLQALPRDGLPVTQWPDRDQAALDVARGIIAALD